MSHLSFVMAEPLYSPKPRAPLCLTVRKRVRNTFPLHLRDSVLGRYEIVVGVAKRGGLVISEERRRTVDLELNVESSDILGSRYTKHNE